MVADWTVLLLESLNLLDMTLSDPLLVKQRFHDLPFIDSVNVYSLLRMSLW